MATYQILDGDGAVINTISADGAFVEAHYPGRYALVPEPEPVDPDYILAEIELSGGDGLVPVGILNDGLASFNATITLKSKAGAALPVTGPFRVPVRRMDGSIKEVVLVQFVAGVATCAYSSSGETGYYQIEERDFDPVAVAPGVSWPVRLSGDSRFKIYREI